MTKRDPFKATLNRRKLIGGAAAAAAATRISFPRASLAQETRTGVDPSTWTPEYIQSIAGTYEIGEGTTAEELSKVVPLDYTGRLTYWWVGPTQASPQIDHDSDAAFWAAFAETYPNITVEKQNLDYNQMLDQIRVAALGNAAPMVAKLPILWGVEFAAKGQLQALGPTDVGWQTEDFWPGALKSVTWDGTTYGVPTNNETMALIWNADLFAQAGLEPEAAPATWDDLVAYSKQIKETTGKDGYGLVARQNAGNTPFRFMPQLWAYGGGALDEADENPTYQTVNINNEGSIAALQAAYQMYVVDQSVPVSALTNTQNENANPFIAGNLGMVISHPSEYAKMLDLASQATGADKEIADKVVESIRYGYLPEGAARRAVVFGGSNIHAFNPDVVDGDFDEDAVRAFIAFSTSPEWSTRLHWVSSNPGNVRGFQTQFMRQRLDEIKFLDVTTSMLPYGIPFPVIPESTEIMNIIVPDMMQYALTETMTVEEAANNAADQINGLLTGL